MNKEQMKIAKYIAKNPSSDLDRIISELYYENEKFKRLHPKSNELEQAANMYVKSRWGNSDNQQYFNATACKKDFLAGASFNKDESDQDKCWSQAISMIEVSDTEGNDYLQKYEELHKKLKSFFTISLNKNNKL